MADAQREIAEDDELAETQRNIDREIMGMICSDQDLGNSDQPDRPDFAINIHGPPEQ